MNTTIQTEFHDTRITGTQIEPIFTQIDKEQHATIVEAAAQTESENFRNRAVQTEMVPFDSTTTQIERPPIHNKRTQTLSI